MVWALGGESAGDHRLASADRPQVKVLSQKNACQGRTHLGRKGVCSGSHGLAIRPAACELDMKLARTIANLPPVAPASLLQGSHVLGVAVPETKLRALRPGLSKTALTDLDQNDIIPS